MAFVLPTFNLTVNIWRFGNPHTNPPDVVTPGQLKAPAMNFAPVFGGSVFSQHGQGLLLPPGTDIRDLFQAPPNSSDMCEVPAGSGRLYFVLWVEDVAKGFANEHRYAILFKACQRSDIHEFAGLDWPTPIP